MQSERGSTGTVVVMITSIAIVGVGGFMLLRQENSGGQGSASASASVQADTAENGASVYKPVRVYARPAFYSLKRVDTRMYTNDTGAYLNTNNAGADTPDAQYVRFDVPDPTALVRIYPSAPVPAPDSQPSQTNSTNSDAVSSPIYYADDQHVYVLIPSSAGSASESPDTNVMPPSAASTTTEETYTLAELAGADPETFQMLGEQYAKDAEHVYLIVTTCDEEGTCTQSLVLIPEADAPTFQEYVTSVVDQPDGSGPVVIDAADVNNVYYDGQVVGSAEGDVLQTRRTYGTIEGNGLIRVP